MCCLYANLHLVFNSRCAHSRTHVAMGARVCRMPFVLPSCIVHVMLSPLCVFRSCYVSRLLDDAVSFLLLLLVACSYRSIHLPLPLLIWMCADAWISMQLYMLLRSNPYLISHMRSPISINAAAAGATHVQRCTYAYGARRGCSSVHVAPTSAKNSWIGNNRTATEMKQKKTQKTRVCVCVLLCVLTAVTCWPTFDITL